MKYEDLCKKCIELLKANHNLILTGAPGTGKTYLAKEIAKQLLHLDSREKLSQDSRYAFVQFHPSYDYTDFVEGLRPINSKRDIFFELKNGLFKNFCEYAISLNKTFAYVYNTFVKDIYNKRIESINLSSGDREVKVDNYFCDSINGSYEENKYIIKKEILLQLWNSFKETKPPLTDVKKYLTDNYLINRDSEASYYHAIYNHLIEDMAPLYSNTKAVIIIDEINRGELSKIFGELFYSIDSGNRGKDGAVQTQYANMQNEPNVFDCFLDNGKVGQFFVPNNVYIIGTMNDIDRSVESMDFAMRRRFAFYEVKAEDTQDEILKYLDETIREEAITRMNQLNNAIFSDDESINSDSEELRDFSSAYHLGAAYFRKIRDYKGDWEKLWNYHLKGTLYEYLRGMPDAISRLKKWEDEYKKQEK